MLVQIELSKLKPNPHNPKLFTQDNIDRIARSLKDFPEMLQIRPLIAISDENDTYLVIDGNGRLEAIKSVKNKSDLITVKLADELSEKERLELIVKSNMQYGEWDVDKLPNLDNDILVDWGIDESLLDSENGFVDTEFDNEPKSDIQNTYEILQDATYANIKFDFTLDEYESITEALVGIAALKGLRESKEVVLYLLNAFKRKRDE